LQTALEEVLDAAMVLLEADMGNIQLFNPQTRELQIAAQRGFGEAFLDHFRKSGAQPSAMSAGAAQRGAGRLSRM
jgi:hypothetical protein